MNALDKDKALAHYSAMSREAAMMASQRKLADAWDAGQAAIAELARWQGKGLMPRPGCGLHQTSLDDAEVWIEYEYEPASGDGWNEPREGASVTVIGILINGVMCDAQDVAPHMVDEWSVEIMEALNDDAQSQFQDRDDSRDDEAADRASDRYERDMDATLISERLAQVAGTPLGKGSHDGLEDGMCVMEAAAYVAGEPWSDQPLCACPTITAFMVSWNDSLPSDAERDRLLKPLIPLLVGTRSTPAVEARRSYMALDWLIRVNTPKWLDLRPELTQHAEALRGLDEVADLAGAKAAGALVRAAWTAARASAWTAAGAAARASAGDAAWAAAWTTAGEAAWTTAWTTAGDAAWTTAWTTAGDAAWACLKPTTEWLQASAVDLVVRMCEVKVSA